MREYAKPGYFNTDEKPADMRDAEPFDADHYLAQEVIDMHQAFKDIGFDTVSGDAPANGDPLGY